MRVLIFATSPLVGSGYATVSRFVSRGLVKRGIPTAIYAWNSHIGTPIDHEGVPIFPKGNITFGWDGLSVWVPKFEADILLTIVDPWIMTRDQWRFGHKAKVVHWMPIHADPPGKASIQQANEADLALCYSQWGTSVLHEHGAPNAVYCPLGVDTSIYYPRGKDVGREVLRNITATDVSDDAFVIGSVAANASTVPFSRKAFDQLLLAFQIVRQSQPNAVLYLHTVATRILGGYDLLPMIDSMGFTVGEDILFPAYEYQLNGLNDETMAQLYSSFDVLANASMAEGFGLPILEAQACGVPVVTTDFSSMPEITKNGVCTRPLTKCWSLPPIEGWCAMPAPSQIAEAILDIADYQPEGETQRGLDLANALTWDRVIDDHLLPLLQGLKAGSNGHTTETAAELIHA